MLCYLSMTTIVDATIKTLQTENAELHNEIVCLEEQLAWFKRQIFGKKSERVVDTQPEQLLFDGFENTTQQAAQSIIYPYIALQKAFLAKAS